MPDFPGLVQKIATGVKSRVKSVRPAQELISIRQLGMEQTYAPLVENYASGALSARDLESVLQAYRDYGHWDRLFKELTARAEDLKEQRNYTRATTYYRLMYDIGLRYPNSPEFLYWSAMVLSDCLVADSQLSQGLETLRKVINYGAGRNDLQHAYLDGCRVRAADILLRMKENHQALEYLGQISSHSCFAGYSQDWVSWMVSTLLGDTHAPKQMIKVVEMVMHQAQDADDPDHWTRLGCQLRYLLSLHPGERNKHLNELIATVNIPDSAPLATSVQLVEEMYGVQVQDNFRWMETESADREQWCQAQDRFAIYSLVPLAWQLRQSIDFLLPDRPQYYAPVALADWGCWAFLMRGAHEYGLSLCKTNDFAEDEFTRIIDHRKLIQSGESLKFTMHTTDGVRVAYGVSKDGADWGVCRIKRFEPNGEELREELYDTRLRVPEWSTDDKGLYYVRHEGPDFTRQSVYYHELHSSTNDDVLIFSGAEGEILVLTVKKGYIFVSTTSDCINLRVFYRRENTLTDTFDELMPDRVCRNYILEVVDNQVVILTNSCAPRFRLVAVNLSSKELTEVIPEASEVLVSVFISDTLADIVAQYHWSGMDRLVHVRDGNRHDIVLNFDNRGKSFALHINGFSRFSANEVSFLAGSYLHPARSFKYNFHTRSTTPIFKESELTFDPEDFNVEQIESKCPDGTVLPIFIKYKRGIRLDAKNPTLLTGYGGFGASVSPEYNWAIMDWINAGGVHASAILRGGLEFGDDWCEAGRIKGQS